MEYPTIDEQRRFWDSWIDESAAWEENPDNARRAEIVLSVARAREHARILEIGCGSGWLALQLAKFGQVTAVDIGAEAIERLKGLHPHICWIGGDFLTLDLPLQNFDLIVSMETISHVVDQEAFAGKIAELAASGCDLILTTQNPFVWKRVSSLKPLRPGQVRNWPSPGRLGALFGRHFVLEPVRTCAPGKGDLGIFKLIRGFRKMRRLVGDYWWFLEERLGLGCSLVLLGKRLPRCLGRE
jgi:2-polyprenyl-3-methyl-5-hydroxy-6-metoxy-1,4-benzoquinol methylase